MRKLVQPIIVLAIIPVLAVLYFVADARYVAFPPCPFFYLTHLYCPGCGSQRAFSAMLHGQPMEALRYNILFVVAIPILLYSGYGYLVSVIKKIPVRQPVFYSNFFAKTVLVAVLAFWILRNIPRYPFNLLAPHVA